MGDPAMEKIDDSKFEVIKVNINPYAYIVDSGFENVNEDMVVNNKTYHVFKNRIRNNVLELYCLKNNHQSSCPGPRCEGFWSIRWRRSWTGWSCRRRNYIAAVTAGEGLIFLSHVEERPDHPVEGLTGMEISNRHYDAIRDPGSLVALALMLTDPKELAELRQAVRRYPDELFAFQCGYPRVYLAAWDAGTQKRRLTGIAANDCHHNNVLIVKMVDDHTVLLGTNVDPDDGMKKVTTASRPGIAALTRGHKPGDVLARVDVDPYRRSFRNVSTHVLAPELTEAALRAALQAGHAYVAHDWMGDPTDFRFEAIAADGTRAGLMGDEVTWAGGLKLSAQFTLPCRVRLLRNGHEIASQAQTASLDFRPAGPGVYRVEGWLTLDGEERPVDLRIRFTCAEQNPLASERPAGPPARRSGATLGRSTRLGPDRTGVECAHRERLKATQATVQWTHEKRDTHERRCGRTMPIRFLANWDRCDSQSRAPERGSATRSTQMTTNRVGLEETVLIRFFANGTAATHRVALRSAGLRPAAHKWQPTG